MTLKEQKGAKMENDNIIISDEALDNFLDIYLNLISSVGFRSIPKKSIEESE